MVTVILTLLLAPILISVGLRFSTPRVKPPSTQLTAANLYYSTANRIAGYIILCMLPFAIGSLVLIETPGIAAKTVFTVAFLFALLFFARFSCQASFDQTGIRGQWFLLPLKKSWSDVSGVETWRNSLGNGTRINFGPGRGFIRHISFAMSFEGYDNVKKLLAQRGLTD